jgi:hypothetical protein
VENYPRIALLGIAIDIIQLGAALIDDYQNQGANTQNGVFVGTATVSFLAGLGAGTLTITLVGAACTALAAAVSLGTLVPGCAVVAVGSGIFVSSLVQKSTNYTLTKILTRDNIENTVQYVKDCAKNTTNCLDGTPYRNTTDTDFLVGLCKALGGFCGGWNYYYQDRN